jgi:hypothetical protein
LGKDGIRSAERREERIGEFEIEDLGLLVEGREKSAARREQGRLKIVDRRVQMRRKEDFIFN